MHYTGQVYRHPMEGQTPLLEVSIGCSHNRCSFCTMYRDTTFKLSPEAHIIEDLQELRGQYGEKLDRIYLLNADPFCLSTDKLVRIGELINEYLPNMKTITCYASIKNFMNKSEEDLKRLKALGYNELHVGVESAFDPALKLMNKGYDQATAYEQIEKLKRAGITYDLFLMMGIAGQGKGKENVQACIDFANKTQPYMVSVMPTSVLPGSELDQYKNDGLYLVPTEREMLEEELMLLKGLELEKAYFFGSHNYNLVPFSGSLNNLKNEMIDHLESKMNTIDESILDSVKFRNPV